MAGSHWISSQIFVEISQELPNPALGKERYLSKCSNNLYCQARFGLTLCSWNFNSMLLRSSFVEGDGGCFGVSSKLLCWWQTQNKWCCTYMFDCWADPVAHLLVLKSSMTMVCAHLQTLARERERVKGYSFLFNPLRWGIGCKREAVWPDVAEFVQNCKVFGHL